MQHDRSDARSPWSTLTDVRAVEVKPLRTSVDATISIPGSKSISNRALIIAGMAEGTTRLSGLLQAEDTYWCMDALSRLGVGIAHDGPATVVTGIGRRRPQQGTIYVGSAGTVARFLPPLLAAGDSGRWRLDASAQMRRRPIAALFEAMKHCGAEVEFHESPSAFPLTVSGASLLGGSVEVSGAMSSQFISALLMAGPQARNGLDLHIADEIVQSDYVRITIDVMRRFGASIDVNDSFTHFRVEPTGFQAAGDYVVEADASTATYFAALAAATRGRLTLTNLTSATRQPDFAFLATLERLGATVKRLDTQTTIACTTGLRGGFTIDMHANSDASLTLSAIAPFADAPISITGIRHIRQQESDRIAAMCTSLHALGVAVQEEEDGLTISPGQPRYATVDSFDDHRVAMSLSILGAIGQGIEILNPTCVSKTCPGFFDLMATLGVEWKSLS